MARAIKFRFGRRTFVARIRKCLQRGPVKITHGPFGSWVWSWKRIEFEWGPSRWY